MRCIRKDNEDVVTKFVKSVIAGDMEQALTLMRAYPMAPLMGPHTMFVSNWLPQGYNSGAWQPTICLMSFDF